MLRVWFILGQIRLEFYGLYFEGGACSLTEIQLDERALSKIPAIRLVRRKCSLFISYKLPLNYRHVNEHTSWICPNVPRYYLPESDCPDMTFLLNHITVPQLPEILFHPPTHSLSFTYEMMIETKLFAQLILLSIYSVLYKYGRHPRPINQRKRKNHPKNVFEINEPFNDDGDPIPRNFHPFWHLTKSCLLLCWGWFPHLRLLHLTDHLHELIIEPDSFNSLCLM